MADPTGARAADLRRLADELAAATPARREWFLAQHPAYRDLDAQQLDAGPVPLARLEGLIRHKIDREWEQAEAMALKSPRERDGAELERIIDLTRETLAAFGVSREDISKYLLRKD